MAPVSSRRSESRVLGPCETLIPRKTPLKETEVTKTVTSGPRGTSYSQKAAWYVLDRMGD